MWEEKDFCKGESLVSTSRRQFKYVTLELINELSHP